MFPVVRYLLSTLTSQFHEYNTSGIKKLRFLQSCDYYNKNLTTKSLNTHIIFTDTGNPCLLEFWMSGVDYGKYVGIHFNTVQSPWSVRDQRESGV